MWKIGFALTVGFSPIVFATDATILDIRLDQTLFPAKSSILCEPSALLPSREIWNAASIFYIADGFLSPSMSHAQSSRWFFALYFVSGPVIPIQEQPCCCLPSQTLFNKLYVFPSLYVPTILAVENQIESQIYLVTETV